jgi:S-methylmethionine-dependent homocysteine/selenocysteine methylase
MDAAAREATGIVCSVGDRPIAPRSTSKRPPRRGVPLKPGRLYLTDAGLHDEAGLRGAFGIHELPPHALLAHSAGRYALARYFRVHLANARRLGTGFVLDAPTAKAHLEWAHELGSSERQLALANAAAVDFVADLRDEFFSSDDSIVLNGVIAGCGAARHGGAKPPTAAEAEDYHAQQIGWLVNTEVDMVTASGFAHAEEAIGVVSAARKAAMPIVLSFGVGVDGCTPGGRAVGDLIAEIDRATRRAVAYYTVDCAASELRAVLERAGALRRIRGLRCTEWQRGPSHDEPARPSGQRRERAEPPGPQRLLELHHRITTTMPWVNVVGGNY